MAGSVHVVFEEGTQAQWLYDLLSPRVDRVIVCDQSTRQAGDCAHGKEMQCLLKYRAHRSSEVAIS